MSKIRVTFDSDASAAAFATKWKLSAPAGNSLDIEWDLAEDAIKDTTVSSHEQLETDSRTFVVKGDRAVLEAHGTIDEDLGNGFFKVSTTTGLNLGKAAEAIDDITSPVKFLGASSISSMSPDTTELDPTGSEGQWARIRVASTYRPVAPSYQLHDVNAVTKPELYIMDTGCDFTHPEFDSPELEKEIFYTCPNIYPEGDQLGHGTAVASMAVGKNLGITTHAKLRTIKIAGSFIANPGDPLDPDAPGHQATILDLGQALDAIQAEVIADPNKTRILNVSWGVARSAYLDQKFITLMNSGVTLVSAAGNDGIDVGLISPAGIVEGLTIGAIDKFDIPAGFNNISPEDSGITTPSGLSLDMFAPGDAVMTANVDGFNGAGLYAINSGTSFAAPLMSGIACVIGSMNAGPVPNSLMKETIMSTGTKNALLFEDSTFTALQNNLGYVFTADPLAAYKQNDMVSYLGVIQPDEAMTVDLNSNLDVSYVKTLFPDDVITYSINWVDPAMEAKYGEYVALDTATGIITITYPTGVTLPADIRLESVEFVGVASTGKITLESNTIFFFNANPDYNETLNSDVTLALSDVNSISFFAYWSNNLK